MKLLYPNDIPAMYQIEELVQGIPWALDIFHTCFRAGYTSWGIEIENKLIGFVMVGLQGDECHILNIGVHPQYQRQGWGMKLLEWALKEAKNKKMGMAYLEVRRSNQRAIALYEKAGFSQIGERKDYYPAFEGREDALIFAGVL